MNKVTIKKVKSNDPGKPNKYYALRIFTDGEMRCSCPGFVYRNSCRHIDEEKSK